MTIGLTSTVVAVAVVATLGRPGIAAAQDARVYAGGAGSATWRSRACSAGFSVQ